MCLNVNFDIQARIALTFTLWFKAQCSTSGDRKTSIGGAVTSCRRLAKAFETKSGINIPTHRWRVFADAH
jgi:hypothetical protein